MIYGGIKCAKNRERDDRGLVGWFGLVDGGGEREEDVCMR